MGGTEATGPEGFRSEYNPGMCAPGEVKTPFATHESIDTMHAMLAWAKPELVIRVAGEWQHIHDHLVGGSGSVKSDFDKAVDHILQHWEGDAADGFAKKAKKISKQLDDCASYAKYTSMAMDDAGGRLKEIKPKVDGIEPPSKASSIANSVGDGFTRDDSRWRGAIHKNQGAQVALDNYDDDLSAGREEQLKAAALMEQLALSYTSQTKAMGSWSRKQKPPPGWSEHDSDDYPGEPGGFVPVPIPMAPDGPTPTPAVGDPTARVPSVSAGGGGPKVGAADSLDGLPASKTNIDAAATTHPTNTGHAELAASAPRSTSPSTGPGAVPPGDVPGGPGRVGRASGNRGMPRAGGGGGAAEEHAASGRRGGMHAGGGGGGGGSKGSGGAASRGPLARRKGGKLDEPHQMKGGSRPVGQGLHSSRGGSQSGERGRNAGMRGAPVSSNNAKRKEDEKNEGQRPDYLVEDEETWMPKRRDVTPPTVD